MGIEGQSSDTGYRATRDFFDGLGSISRGAPPFNRPTGVALSSSGDIVYVTELCLRMSIFSYDGNLLARWGNEQHPIDAPLFIAPHTLAVD